MFTPSYRQHRRLLNVTKWYSWKAQSILINAYQKYNHISEYKGWNETFHKDTVTPISGGIIYVRKTFYSITAMENQPVIPNEKFECPIQVAYVIYG